MIQWMLQSMVASETQFEKFALKIFVLWANSFWSSGFLNLRKGGMRYNKSIKNRIMLVFINLFVFKNLTQSKMFKKQYDINVIGNAIFKNQWLFACPFVTVNISTTISKMFNAIKSIPTEIKS